MIIKKKTKIYTANKPNKQKITLFYLSPIIESHHIAYFYESALF